MAREVVTLHGFLNKLEPAFDDCPAMCARDEGRERQTFCDECDAGAQYDFFRKSFAEVAGRRQLSPEFTFARLYRDVTRALATNSAHPRGYPRGCSALDARRLEIVRYELTRPERRRSYALQLKIAEAEAKAARNG